MFLLCLLFFLLQQSEATIIGGLYVKNGSHAVVQVIGFTQVPNNYNVSLVHTPYSGSASLPTVVQIRNCQTKPPVYLCTEPMAVQDLQTESHIVVELYHNVSVLESSVSANLTAYNTTIMIANTTEQCGGNVTTRYSDFGDLTGKIPTYLNTSCGTAKISIHLHKNSRLSGGSIAGIVIGVVAFFLIFFVIIPSAN